MKKSNLYLLTLTSISFLILSSCGEKKKKAVKDTATEEIQSVMEVTPELVFENDYAKVSKISLSPGELLSTHEGENRVIYSLTDYSIDWEEQGKSLGTKKWKKGDVHFHEAGTHAAENNGTTTAEWLVFTRKNTELPECGDNTIENDVNSVSPDFTKVLFDNEFFKITEVNLANGESIPMHSGINRIIYPLSDYQLKYESDKEGRIDKQFKAGDAHWHEACQHALENAGETAARFLVVSYKTVVD